MVVAAGIIRPGASRDCVPLSSVASGNSLSLGLLTSTMGIQNICLYRILVKNLTSHAWDVTF